MSSSEDSDAGPKRKRKVRRLEDSPGSTSSGSPIIGNSSTVRLRRRQQPAIIGSSDSDSSPILTNHKRKIRRVSSDSDMENSDDSDLVHRRPGIPVRLQSDSEGDSSSQWESDLSDQEDEMQSKFVMEISKNDSESEMSDGQSEKCPICLVSFKTQEIGTPEACDHMFCLECIQEWSKNVNTCPVDRQEYSLILVRDQVNRKVTRQIPVERPVPQNLDIIEDPTFCEICGSNDHEDRMLLCDGCNLGFHLYCLTPPLSDIPAGSWYCDSCNANSDTEQFSVLQYLFQEYDDTVGRALRPTRSNRSSRIIPRTRQTERVRRQIANNRLQNSPADRGITENSTVSSTSRSGNSRRKRKRKPKYRTVYEIDPTTGLTEAVQKRVGRRRKTRKERKTAKPKTVKKRLAKQLGMCGPRNVPQNLPDVKLIDRPVTASGTINSIRHGAGIPTLDLFGQNNDLDYFTDEEDFDSGVQVLVRRAPNRSDVNAIRRTIRRKNAVMPEVVSSTSDLLDSILSSQEQLYARNASYSIDATGKFKIDAKTKTKIDVNKEKAQAKETPYYNPNRNYNRYGGNKNYNRYNQNRYQRPSSNNYYHSNNQNFYHNEPSSSMNYSNNYGNDNNDYPQDYSSRTLSGNSEENRENEQEEEEVEGNEESELDIYSDIETVTTTKADDSEYRPLSPPPMPTLPLLGFEDDNNDSEPDMVIDDEKVAQEPEKENEYYKEETAVTSTVGFEPVPAPSCPIESDEIQSEAIQSSSLENIKTYDYYNDDSLDGCPNTSIYSKNINKTIDEDGQDTDDECPNFSIYSKESKTMALHTDLSLSSEKNQVGEISSSPNFEQPEENVVPADPDQMYDPEETFNEPEEVEEAKEQEYDPERDSTTPTLDHTYDPDNCMRSDETLATDAEKTLDPDQSYDPENVYEESSSADRNDIEKEIYNFNDSKDESNAEGRYDPALPFSDDLDESNRIKEVEDEVNKPEDRSGSEKKKSGGSNLLYSDSEDDESVVKKDKNSFAVADINKMTEDISEEERSYTPCLDEKSQKQGLEGLETEMISDEERNDFDEGNDLKTASDGDALEINAKESEMDFTRPEDYEEGEIVDKNKDKESLNEENEADKSKEGVLVEVKKTKKKDKEKTAENEKGGNKENEEITKDSSFKKLSKSNKDRNYRDKERRPSSRNRSTDRDSKREKKKEKRKELERYNVRAIIAEKPRPLIAKDQFGRDIRNTPSRSRSRSYTPPIRSGSRQPAPDRSPSKARSRRSASRSRRSLSRRRSASKEKSRKRRKSRNYRSRSRSRSPIKKGQKNKKRKRSTSRFRKRKSDEKPKNKRRARSRRRSSRSPSPVRRPRDRERADWSPNSQPHMSPSWTPPRLIDNAQLLRTESLTVTVNNNKKKKDKKKKERRNKEPIETRAKKRRHERERTPPPSKEVFASGDNILVSVSFNNENEKRDITTRDKRKNDEASSAKKRKKRKNKKDLTGIKPVAIIDLDRSPFRELTPSPKQIIVLTDSENEDAVQGNVCDSSQQVASPERGIGPKTPPEPQVKFSLAPKAPQIRAINNPLIDPDDIETNVQSDSRMSPGHKGPSTPQEPPNSPPSSPDAYDPFEPTKSRSPTPDLQVQSNQDGHESIDSRAAIDLLEKSMNPMPENAKSLTPPLADVQPADSQSSVQVVTPDSNIDKSPDNNRPTAQIQNVQQSAKPVAQTIPFSSVPTSLNTSTPLSTNLLPSRINILNATVISPPVASPIPQRIVLPNLIKSNSAKVAPTKSAIKSTPIKPMPAKTNKVVTRKRTQNGSGDDNLLLDFDSPYSPGSSDYEDLFDPPSEIVTKPIIKGKTKSPMKHATSAFDALFGSPSYNPSKPKKKFGKKSSGKTKTVGVRLDEDNLKILDELPNSAVEMQVKDKFLKKLNRQERVVEEVKLVLKPHYNKKRINKEEYKDIMRRSVPKICHNKSGEINPTKIKNLIEAYVRKVRHSKKVTSSSSSVNPLKM